MKVQAGPDTCVDELGKWLRERVEPAHPRIGRAEKGGRARDLEASWNGVAEEHAKRGDVGGIEAVVPGRMLGIGSGDEGGPARIGSSRRVPVLTSPRNRVPRPPEVVVV